MLIFRSKKDEELPQVNKPKAFSLTELAIVLAVIGILTAGIMNGAGLVNSARLAAARSLVAESPVPKISDLVIWLESSGKNAFAVGTGSSFTNVPLPSNNQKIGVWNNINPQIPSSLRQNLVQGSSANQPTYAASSINGLPALRFNRALQQYLDNAKILLNRAGLSIFVVTKRRVLGQFSSMVSGSTIINGTIYDDAYSLESLTAFRETDYSIMSRRNSIDSGGPHPGNNIPFIAATIFNGFTHNLYVNGVVINGNNSSFNKTASFFINYLRVGCRIYSGGSPLGMCYDGDIAEVIIYQRGLSSAEIDLVEAYLSKKYKITIS